VTKEIEVRSKAAADLLGQRRHLPIAGQFDDGLYILIAHRTQHKPFRGKDHPISSDSQC